jgi:hypothetical protein
MREPWFRQEQWDQIFGALAESPETTFAPVLGERIVGTLRGTVMRRFEGMPSEVGKTEQLRAIGRGAETVVVALFGTEEGLLASSVNNRNGASRPRQESHVRPVKLTGAGESNGGRCRAAVDGRVLFAAATASMAEHVRIGLVSEKQIIIEMPQGARLTAPAGRVESI